MKIKKYYSEATVRKQIDHSRPLVSYLPFHYHLIPPFIRIFLLHKIMRLGRIFRSFLYEKNNW